SKVLISAAAILTASVAFAGEQVLEFKLVTFRIDPKVLEAPNIDGQTITASKAFGVAYFKDGRVAAKELIFSTKLRHGSGPLQYLTKLEEGTEIPAGWYVTTPFCPGVVFATEQEALAYGRTEELRQELMDRVRAMSFDELRALKVKMT